MDGVARYAATRLAAGGMTAIIRLPTMPFHHVGRWQTMGRMTDVPAAVPAAARHAILVSTDEMSAHLHDARWAVVDCRFDLDDVTAGERAYREAHVPGAVYAHLDRHLSGPRTGVNGRHPLPSPEQMSATFGELGLEGDLQIAVYDQGPGMYAARLWWMLRYLGHDAVAVVDGGFAKWVAEGRPVRAGEESRPPRRFVGAPRPGMLVRAGDLEHRLAGSAPRLIDARSPERYRGEVEPLDPVAGHIPGAVNHHYQQSLGEDGTFLPSAELKRRLAPLLGDEPASHAVCYCGSGVAACHNLLAMAHAGLGLGRLYAGSWSEWCADPARPVARG